MKFRQYSYGKKSIDTFLNKIKETFGENILIGYGNWSRNTQMKHFMPTMNKGLRKLIHKRYDTITINECNTSKKCCGCLSNLNHYKDKTGKEIFRLLVCSNCVSCENKKVVFRTRDIFYKGFLNGVYLHFVDQLFFYFYCFSFYCFSFIMVPCFIFCLSGRVQSLDKRIK
jgi:hypothetical protein